jgi:subtilase family serine protease
VTNVKRVLIGSTVAALVAATAFMPAHSTARHAVQLRPAVAGHVATVTLDFPPTTADCQALAGINCYDPSQFQEAYNLKPLWRDGFTGKGRTIVIVDPFGSPTIRNDLHVFDQQYGYADPELEIIQPAGAVPPFDPTDPVMSVWAAETTLDVEWAHAIAPGAKILLVETPVAETEGVEGFPEIVRAENYVIDHNLGDVITQSFGATEETFDSPNQILGLRSAFRNAAAHHVTVLASTGDFGATNPRRDGETLYPFPTTLWPATDPLVTALGGTQLFLHAAGHRTSPDVVWNDAFGATGGGLSKVFPRPIFQAGLQRVVDGHRGIPDISMSAAVDGGVVVYKTFDPANRGWEVFGGTSESSPTFAGLVAIADQLAGHRLGWLNPELYLLRHLPSRLSGIVDVTTGDNTFAGVTGFRAQPGYDLASGIGTVDANRFCRTLAGHR